MYSYEADATLNEQIEECAEHMFLKHGVYPNVAYIHPVVMGRNELNYKTKKGKTIRLVPDETQRTKSFVDCAY